MCIVAHTIRVQLRYATEVLTCKYVTKQNETKLQIVANQKNGLPAQKINRENREMHIMCITHRCAKRTKHMKVVCASV